MISDDTPISSIDFGGRLLNVRVQNVAREIGAETVGAMRAKSDKELLDLPNFGRKALAALRSAIGAPVHADVVDVGLDALAPFLRLPRGDRDQREALLRAFSAMKAHEAESR